MEKSPDKQVSRVARELADARTLVTAKGGNARKIIDDAADALDQFAIAQHQKADINDILAQGRLDTAVLSDRAKDFARTMAGGKFAAYFRDQLSKVGTDDSQPLFNRFSTKAEADAETNRIRRVFNNIKPLGVKGWARAAKTAVDKAGLLNLDAPATAIYNEAVKRAKGRETGFRGAYLSPGNTIAVRTALMDVRRELFRDGDVQAAVGMDRIINKFDEAADNEFGDVTLAYQDSRFEATSRYTAQEELGHRADARSGQSDTTPFEGVDGYEQAKAHLRTQNYGENSLHREIIGKIQRDDAAKALGITEAQVTALRAIRDQQLYDDGISVETYLDRYGSISESNKRRAKDYEQKFADRSRVAKHESQERGDDRVESGDGQEIRTRSDRTGPPDLARTQSGPDLDGLRRASLLSADRGADRREGTALTRRTVDDLTKTERKDASAIAREMPGFDDVLFSVFDMPTTEEISFLKKWVITKRETPIKEIVVNFRKSGLLTGFRTHLRNMLSNSINQGTEEAIRIPAWVADLAASGFTGERTVQLPSGAALFKSFRNLVSADATMKALDQQSGIGRAWNILKNGNVEELKKNQVKEMQSGLPLLDMFVNGTFRLLSAEDALFKTFALRRSLEEQAKTLAIIESRELSQFNSPADRQKFIAERTKGHLAAPSKGMLVEAKPDADFATFTNDNPISVLEIAVPYDRTPTNIVRRTIEHTPIGYGFAAKSPADRQKFIAERTKEHLAAPSKGMLFEAMLYADFATFTNSNPISDLFAQVKDINPNLKAALEIAVPYDRTPTNIVLRTIEHTPIGYGFAAKHLYDRHKGKSYTFENLRKRYAEDYAAMDANRAGGRERANKRFRSALEDIDAEIKSAKSAEDTAFWEREKIKVEGVWKKIKARRSVRDAFRLEDRAEIEAELQKIFPRVQQRMFAKSFGRASFGSGVVLLGFYFAAKGLLSGIWDPGERDESREFYKRRNKGILNGSLQLGNRRYVINDTPAGKAMILGASFWERSQRKPKKKEQWVEKIFRDTTDVGAGIAFEQPLLNSADDYFGSDKSVQKRVGGLLGSFVPTILADIADVSDAEARRNEKIHDATVNRIPVLRNYIAPKAKYPREPALQDTGGRLIQKIDPTNSRGIVVNK